MKTTLEIPDEIFRHAKATAAHQGQSLKQLFTDALTEKLQSLSFGAQDKPAWMEGFGAFKRHKREISRIQKFIDQDFSNIHPEDWQ